MKTKHKGISYARYGYLFVIPFLLAYLAFNFYPTLRTALLGFTDCKGLGNTTMNFLKEDRFKYFKMILQNPSFITAFKNTWIIWIVNFIPQIGLALLLTAWFTNPRCKLRGQGFFKVMFYMPNIITAASVAILFNALFAYPIGPMQDLIKSMGWNGGEPYYFGVQPLWAKGIVAFIQFWQWYGYTAIIFISAVLGINPEIFEAAEIDGANGAQTFFRITLPNIRTIMLFTLINSLIGGLNMYDIPKLFLNGGPNSATLTTTMFIQNQAFAGSYMYNRAAAASMLLFLVIAVCSGIIFFLYRDKDAIAQKKLEKAALKAAKRGEVA